MRSASALTVIAFYLSMAWPCAAEEQPTGPTFDCTHATSRLGRAICQDPSSWGADWALSTSYYALYWSQGEPDRARLRDAHAQWYDAVARECGVEGNGTPTQPRAGACIAQKYRARAASYKGSLSGDAAAEAGLAPASLQAIQKRLVSLGLMSGEPDGIYGSGTRQAIRAFKQSRGTPPSDFLTAQERSDLIRGTAPVAAQNAYRPSRPPPAYDPRPPSDPRQMLPEMLSGMLNGGWPPRPGRQPPYRRQDQSGYGPDDDRPPEFRPGQARPLPPPSNSWQGEGGATPPVPGMAEFNAPKATQGKPMFAGGPADRKPDTPSSEFSDSGSSVVTSPLGGKPRPSDPATKTVEVVGSGDTADAARKDAARLAIQQVAGVFIDNRRRVELNMTDNKVSEIVNEKLISYTNAYVSKFDIVKTEQKSGTYEVTAKVAVSVAPLLKTLQANDVPTVPFDTVTAAATTQTMGDEKVSASEMYLDLLGRAPTLVNVGVGQPSVDTALPSTAEEAWLRIPLSFSVNDEALKEWNAKFKLIAQNRATIDMKIETLRPRGRLNSECSHPQLASDLHVDPSWQASFLTKQPPGDAYGIAACFTSYQTTAGISVECFGRSFVTGSRFLNGCEPGQKCYDFDAAVRSVKLVIEFVGADKSVVYGTKTDLEGFPALARDRSISVPRGREKSFLNYCAGQPSMFFSLLNERSFARATYGDVIVFPAKSARAFAYFNVLVPNSVVSSIVEVRARIEKSGGEAGR